MGPRHATRCIRGHAQCAVDAATWKLSLAWRWVREYSASCRECNLFPLFAHAELSGTTAAVTACQVRPGAKLIRCCALKLPPGYACTASMQPWRESRLALAGLSPQVRVPISTKGRFPLCVVASSRRCLEPRRKPNASPTTAARALLLPLLICCCCSPSRHPAQPIEIFCSFCPPLSSACPPKTPRPATARRSKA